MFTKKTISHICSILVVIVFLLSFTPVQAMHAADGSSGRQPRNEPQVALPRQNALGMPESLAPGQTNPANPIPANTAGKSFARSTAAPANDDFDTPIVISSLPYTNTQDVKGATTAVDDPAFGCASGNKYYLSVWYRYTPSVSGTISVDNSNGSNYYRALAVWTGSRGSLVSVGCSSTYASSYVEVAVTAGTAYYIEVVAQSEDNPSTTLVLNVDFVTPPTNDDFGSPILISGGTPYTNTQDIRMATTAPDDPGIGCYNSLGNKLYMSVWYRYTPGVSGTLLLDNVGSDYIADLAVWTGSRGSLVPVGCERTAYLSQYTYMNVAVTAGTTYYIEAVSESSTYPPLPDVIPYLTLNADFVLSPANDDFNSPIVISSLPYTNTQDVKGATTAMDDPGITGTCTLPKYFRSVWYQYTPSVSSTYLVDTSGSNYSLLVAIWTGSRGSLASAGCLYSSTTYLNLTTGTTYYFEAVALYPGDAAAPSSLTLALNIIPPPANDDFGSPIDITTMPYTHTQDVKGATTATDDPALGCASGNQDALSVWYRYTPSVSGTLLLNNSGSDYYSPLAVWTGSRGSLVQMGCNSGYPSSNVSVAVSAGTAYYIEAVATYAGTTSTSLTLNASFLLPPSNDDFGSPILISGGLPYTHTQDVAGATSATDDPYISPTNSASGKFYQTVWYRYTPSASGTYLFDTSGSNYSTLPAIWTGNRGGLTLVGNAKYYSPSTQGMLTAGTTYSIEVASLSDHDIAPSLMLTVSRVPPPDNDDFNSPIVISGALPYTHTQDVSGATTAADDPGLFGGSWQGVRSVWYQYTTAASGTMVLDMWGTSYQGRLAVWTGSRGSLAEAAESIYDTSNLEMLVTAGTTYYIEAVANYTGDQSPSLTLSVDVVPTPANDDFNSPIVISGGFPYTHSQDVYGATTAADDPGFDCALGKQFYRSVWYSYTPSSSGTLSVDTYGSSYDTQLGVWTGSRGSLALIGCGDGYAGSTAHVAVSAGTVYYIEIAKYFSLYSTSLKFYANFIASTNQHHIYLPLILR